MFTLSSLHTSLGLDRFQSTPRSANSTDEDLFCTQLREIGGKWWGSWRDYQEATKFRMRMMWPDERGGAVSGMARGRRRGLVAEV